MFGWGRLQGNGQVMCPLVGWYQGRVRLIEGQAYTDDGREVFLKGDGDFGFGAQRALPEVVTARDTEFRAVFSESSENEAPLAPGGSTPRA